jgi:hypothetical protein
MPGEPTEAPIALSGPIDTSHLLQQVGFIQSGKQKRLFPFVTLTERLLRDEDFRARIDRVRYSGFFSGEQYFRPFDVGIEHFDVHRDTGGGTSGFGVLTKWQISPAFEKKPDPSEKVTSYIEALKKPQLSLTAAHRRLRDSGRATDFGASISQLRSIRQRGVTPSLSVEHARLNPDGAPSRSGWRVSATLTVQNRSVYDYERACQYNELDEVRWRWMLGMGYTFENSVDRDDSFIFFVRRRRPKAYGVEVSAFGGRSRRDTTFYGVTLQYSFLLKREQTPYQPTPQGGN